MSLGTLVRYGLPFSNVVNTGVATNQVTPGKTLETMRLKLGGTSLTKAMIDILKVKANGKVIIEASGTQLDKIAAYRGESVNAAFLDVDFADSSMRTDFDCMVSALDTTQGIANITTEVSIVGANAPTLTPILIESAAQKSNTGAAQPFAPLMTKLLRYPFSQATGGKLPVTVPFGQVNGAIIKRLHVFHGGYMTGATVKQDGLVVHESLKAENEFLQTKLHRVPQTNVYTIDFVPEGDITTALNTRDAQSLEWLFDFSQADSGWVIVEYLAPLGTM